MPLKLWDFECKKCGIFEGIVESGEDTTTCKCGAEAHRIFTPSGIFTANQTSEWIRTVVDVVDKDNPARHVQEFVKNPTRDNYKAWMKGEGLRPAEIGRSQHGEDYDTKMARKAYEDNHNKMMTDAVMRRRVARRRIEIR